MLTVSMSNTEPAICACECVLEECMGEGWGDALTITANEQAWSKQNERQFARLTGRSNSPGTGDVDPESNPS